MGSFENFWLVMIMAILSSGDAILDAGSGSGSGRDFLLTPKLGPQLNSKHLFYEPPDAGTSPKRTKTPSAERPWEHTLKHVTFVTLFTDSAVEAAAGNLSQLHQYHDFLQSPYTPAADQRRGADRFGDIVTLAKGYLEQLPGGGANDSFRFLEAGAASHLNPNQRRALWQVQRIRHRDGDVGRHHYHYEMKFSVTPLENKAWQPHHRRSYIQKESDYPASFGRLAHQPGFAQRRQDQPDWDRDRDRDREQSQATFVHGIFQPSPPQTPLLPPQLNIGEYLKGVAPPEGPKLELFPGLFGNVGLRPTTFRPNYPAIKFGPNPEPKKFPTGQANNELINPGGSVGGAPSGVTHHFHHHFYVAQPEITTQAPPPPPFYHQTVLFPSSTSTSSESGEEHQERDMRLRGQTAQIYGQASKYQTAKLSPLLIYPTGDAEGEGLPDDNRSSLFVQSEPLEETVYRYSEPDPLYVHENPLDVLPKRQPEIADTERYQDQVERYKEPVQEPESDSASHSGTSTTRAPVTSTTVTPAPAEATPPPTAAPPAALTTSSSSFVSTSTHFSPLRSISRYRSTSRITAGKSTTTSTTTTTTSTEPPLSKWAKRRKELDSKAKGSSRHEAYAVTKSSSPTPSTATSSPTPTPTPTPSPIPSPSPSSSPRTQPAAPAREVVEVLTQKSVSRSVSIKVGENGEEIPIFVDDEENEVKPSPSTK